jgi:dual specificity tyrosine-phosphorylation-regulated kinase 2/3/4
MAPRDALKFFKHLLSDYEAEEILSFPTVYFMRTEAKETTKPRKHSPENPVKNHGYDNKDGEYICDLRDSIAYRYEIIKRIGKGSFGQVFECKDHKTGETVALKILKNEDRLTKQGLVEAGIVRNLNKLDPDGLYAIVKLIDHFMFREHLMLTFELLSMNLYDFLK